MISRPFSLPSLSRKEAMFFTSISVLLPKIPYVLSISQRNRFKFPFSARSMEAAQQLDTKHGCISGILRQETSPISGVEDALMGFISGKRKATELAHAVWQNVVQKGDTVIDATCGNGHDTLALLEMVADESGKGCVYGMDIQDSALENSSSLLEMSVSSNKRKLVKLFSLCHSKMEDVVQKGSLVRLVAFNLGYLPGGDKSIITTSETTLLALQAASRVLGSGGLISAMVYVGHPGGRDELETVQTFSSGLSVEKWVCYKFESLNRPTSPVLVLLFKK